MLIKTWIKTNTYTFVNVVLNVTTWTTLTCFFSEDKLHFISLRCVCNSVRLTNHWLTALCSICSLRLRDLAPVQLEVLIWSLRWTLQENATSGEHLWVDTSISGDFCYVGESECTVAGLVLIIFVLRKLTHNYNKRCIAKHQQISLW